MTQMSTAASPANGAASTHELFALTDEQILEIEPVDVNDAVTVEQPLLAVPTHSDGKDNTTQRSARSAASTQTGVTEKPAQAIRGSEQVGMPVLPAEPPAWLARQMNDPWVGEEARELFARLRGGPSNHDLERARAGADYVAKHHTWQHRLRQIAEVVGQ